MLSDLKRVYEVTKTALNARASSLIPAAWPELEVLATEVGTRRPLRQSPTPRL